MPTSPGEGYVYNSKPATGTSDYSHSFTSVSDDIFAYQNGDDIVVSGVGILQVYDVMGRLVTVKEIHGVETMYTSSLQSGVYIFRMVGETIMTQKIVVR